MAVLDDLGRIGGLLNGDHDTHMPPGGGAARGEHLATIGRLHHERLVEPRLGELLDAADGVPEPVRAAVRRDHVRARRVPEDLVAEMARAGAEGRAAWLAARAARDFAPFAAALERNVELRRRLADCFPEADHPYDALLDAFEPGLTSARLRGVFGTLRARLVPLIEAIAAAPRPASLPGPFDVGAQREVALDIARSWGFDDDAWRFDLAVHPFAMAVGLDDVRVTGRFAPDDLSGLFAVMHEVGHGLYEHQVDRGLARTTAASGVSLGMHESQSRLWENWVGRSRPFLELWHPRLVDAFGAEAVGGEDPDALVRAVNVVEPTLKRVEADEATYALHVILRFELEVELVEGTLAVADLPDAWNARTKELLGLDVPHDTAGVLQDIHWSLGELGYFPTYAIGTIVAAQLWDAFTAEAGPFDPADPAPLREWLRLHVHRHGRTVPPEDLLRAATGSALDAEPLLRYLEEKYRGLYGLG